MSKPEISAEHLSQSIFFKTLRLTWVQEMLREWTSPYAVPLPLFCHNTCLKSTRLWTLLSAIQQCLFQERWLDLTTWHGVRHCFPGSVTSYKKGSLLLLFFLHIHLNLRPPLWSSDQSSWLLIQRSGFDSLRYQIFWEIVGLEKDPLSLVTTIEELLERKISDSGRENRKYGRRDPSRWPRGTLYQ
jgi:hypothetical protein